MNMMIQNSTRDIVIFKA